MLRKLKIGTRLNVLIGVPLIALTALAGASFVSLQRASVRGSEYGQLKVAEDLRSDLAAPRANLIAAWSSVAKIGVLVASPVTSRTNGEILAELNKLKAARADFFAAIDYWRAQPLAPAQMEALGNGARSGEVFFDKVDSLLLSSMVERNRSIVLSAVRAIEYDYNIQQIYIAQSLELVDREVAAREQSTNQFVTTVQLLIIAAVIALLLAVLVVAFFVRRSIVRPILALSAHARRAATTELAQAVRQIQSLPAGAATPSVEAFRTGTSDELADLGDSFNSMQAAALDLASEQAVARRAVSENLVNIARRTQGLLGRSLGSLSDMEQSERDPQMLDKLFRLDHLATRMRRNAQSLLVLADAQPNRLWSAPVPVGEVVRAALSEIEHYTRVELADLGDQGRVMVKGALAADVAHLLAELLENATSFSPPSTKVMVVGRSIGNGHQLAIVDYGIGMSQEQLDAANESLRRRVDLGTESNRMLGFQVVARLAERLGIQVVLANTAGATGITVIIRLPEDMFEARFVPPTTAANGARLLTPGGEDPVIDDAQLLAMAGQEATPPGGSGPPPDAPLEQPGVVTPVAALTKRVRGAQLPDLGSDLEDLSGWERPAAEVRTSLSSLQRGTDLARGREHATLPISGTETT